MFLRLISLETVLFRLIGNEEDGSDQHNGRYDAALKKKGVFDAHDDQLARQNETENHAHDGHGHGKIAQLFTVVFGMPPGDDGLRGGETGKDRRDTEEARADIEHRQGIGKGREREEEKIHNGTGRYDHLDGKLINDRRQNKIGKKAGKGGN